MDLLVPDETWVNDDNAQMVCPACEVPMPFEHEYVSKKEIKTRHRNWHVRLETRIKQAAHGLYTEQERIGYES